MTASPLAERSQPQLLLDLLMHGLRVRDEQLNVIAAELLTRFGLLPLRELALTARNRQNRPEHRVRALAVIARIGPPYGMGMMDLATLLRDSNKRVREAVRRLFGDFTLLIESPAANESLSSQVTSSLPRPRPGQQSRT